MNKLIWVYDSPFSRSIKWLLLKQGIEHEDYVLTWQQMADDELLAANPKRQVPTLLIPTLNSTQLF
jgi:glutathione S-transferase